MANTNDPPKLGPNAGKTLGKSGTLVTGGIISLEEYNRKLVGKQALNQYDIMRRSDSTIRAVMQVVKLPLLAASWSMQAAHVDDTEPDQVAKQEMADYKARFVQRELMNRNVNFNNLLKSLLSGLEFGFDVEEKTFELTEFEGQTRIGIKSISKRKQTTILTWALQDGVTPGITQFLPNGGNVYIPQEKLMVFTHDKEGDNYEGISMLRYVYKDWDIKDKLTIVNAIAIEKLAVGVPVIEEKEGQTASESDKQKGIDTVSNMRANEKGYMFLPSSLGVAMLDLKSNSTKEVIPTLNYHDGRISKSILAGFLEIGGHSGSGSQALAKDLTSLFMKSEEGLANLIISTVQEQLIKQICDFNFTDNSEGYPQLTVSNLADDDLPAIALSTSQLVTSGALTPEADLEDHLREIMGMPLLPEEIKDNYQDFRPNKPVNPNNPLPVDPNAKDLPDDKTKASLISQIKAARMALIAAEYGS